MANKRISELPTAGALTGAELVESVQGGINVKTTSQDIANLAAGGVTSVNSQTGAVVLTATNIGSTAAVGIAATTVQGAIDEIALEKADIPVIDDTAITTDYMLTLADDNNQLRLPFNLTVARTLTIPLNATHAFPIGYFKTFIRRGAETLTISNEGGVTLTYSSGAGTDPGENIPFAVLKTGTNTWDVYNGLPTPVFAAWTPTLGGFSGTPTVTARVTRFGKIAFCHLLISGTSNATTFTFTLPYTSANTTTQRMQVLIQNNGVTAAGMMDILANSTTVNVYLASGGAFTGSGTKGAYLTFFYEMA